MPDIKKQKFQALVADLGRIRGRHTELVSVYVPADFNLNTVVTQLRQEQSTAQNIKSKAVRKNVLSALEKILGHLKLYKATPPNGLAVFCGNVSEKEGVADIQLWAIEPPEKIKVRLYRCDQTFVLEPLQEIFREKEIYGLIVLDKSEADVGLLKGKKVEVIKHMDSIVPGKTKKGGQSSARFARVREGLLIDFLKKVSEVAVSSFRDMRDLQGIIVGGPGPIKEKFMNEGFLPTDIHKKVLGTIDTSYTGEYGLKELIERGDELLSQASVIKEKQYLDRFFEHFAKDTGLAVYGIREVIGALKEGNMEMLLISEEFDWVKAEVSCTCGFKEERIVTKPELPGTCPKCGKKLTVSSEHELIEEIVEMGEKMNTEVVIVSTHTQKGVQLKELGGIAGILRFRY